MHYLLNNAYANTEYFKNLLIQMLNLMLLSILHASTSQQTLYKPEVLFL